MVERARKTVTIKPVSESKTVWISALTLLVGVLVWAGVVTPESWPAERVDAVAGTILMIVGAVNAVLRMYFTSAPLTTNKNL